MARVVLIGDVKLLPEGGIEVPTIDVMKGMSGMEGGKLRTVKGFTSRSKQWFPGSDGSGDEPKCVRESTSWHVGEIWVYRGKSWYLTSADGLSDEEKTLEIKNAALRHERRYKQLHRQTEAFARFEQTESARRERIPDEVKMFVWQRDEGKCVRCGSKDRLEYDHVIPVSKGGSNTERNIQLLCELCNRSKGGSV